MQGLCLQKPSDHHAEKDGAPPFGKLKVLSRVEGQAAALHEFHSPVNSPPK